METEQTPGVYDDLKARLDALESLVSLYAWLPETAADEPEAA